MNSGIYQITHVDTGRIYIGQSTNFRRRISQYKKKDTGGKKTYIESAIKKHGWGAFDFKVLVYAEGKEFLDLLEQRIIRGFETVSPKGYNLRHGGNTTSFSEETRKKMAIAKKEYFADPKNKEKLRQARSKQTISAEAYKQRGLCARGQKWMNNGVISCKVAPDDFENKLANGYVFGRTTHYLNDEYKNKQRANTVSQWAKVKKSGHTGNLVKV
ncbi:MAG: GIY-YIG nuclease family protein [Sphingobacteriia bacterium]|nr:GIY-YIG nuclease family protein [Sphingobacteriia bacterium]